MKFSTIVLKNISTSVFFTLLASLMIVNPAFAWGAKISPIINNVASALKEMGVPLITIALMFIGYQIAFSTKTLKALVPVIIGCLVVGSAPMLAQLLLT